MKTFAFTTTISKNAKYGQNVTCNIYRIKNNKPIILGQVFYNTGMYKGHDQEALSFLVKNKHLPKKCSENGQGNYINYNELDKSFRLFSI